MSGCERGKMRRLNLKEEDTKLMERVKQRWLAWAGVRCGADELCSEGEFLLNGNFCVVD